MNDNVNHPKHYAGKIECIDAMKQCFGTKQTQDFCKLNAFKYLWRCENKNNKLEDIKKAIWYLNKYVELNETMEQQRFQKNVHCQRI